MFDALSEYDRIKDPRGSKYDESRARTCFRLSMGTVLALFVAYLVFNYVVINGERLAEESGALPSSVTGDAVDAALPQTADAEGAAAAAAPAVPGDVAAVDGAQTSNAVEQLLSDAQEHAVVDEVAPGVGAAQEDAVAANAEEAAQQDAAAGAEVAVDQAEVAADEDAAVQQDVEQQQEEEEEEQVAAAEEGGSVAAQQDDAAAAAEEETEQADAANAAEDEAAEEQAAEEEASPMDSLLGSSDMHGVQWWLGAGFGFLGLATLVLLCANTAPPSAAMKQRLLDDERHSYTVLV